MQPTPTAGDDNPLFRAHPREHGQNRYVYPVLSRRARGLSVGVNLNPDRSCNFHCIYCQVPRPNGPVQRAEPIDIARLEEELHAMLHEAASGEIFRRSPFDRTPSRLQRLNDIALSGDGEPTACPQFEQVVALCADLRKRYRLADLKIVLITNASLFHRAGVERALAVLHENNGEIWAKLDAGTEAYYRLVARSAVPFRRILGNLQHAARRYPLVIQSLLMRIRGEPPAEDEIAAYCDRLNEIAAVGTIRLVQLYTIARMPAESWVEPLSDGQLEQLAQQVRRQTSLPVESFGGY